MKCFVGFDTSNYTTSAAVADADGKIIANLKLPLSVNEGGKGLRQSDAVFQHVKNLPRLTSELSAALRGYTPVAVGVSVKPRDAENSYMPCFLVGKSAAYAFASPLGIPVRELSHQNGHVMAALYSAKKTELLQKERFLAFHVSGGTTEALLITPRGRDITVELVGNTLDINAGQAIDRIGVAMGLKFPCGQQLEALAKEFDGDILRKNVCVRDGMCNLSGLENMALKLHKDTNDESAVAAFAFDFIGRTIEKMCVDIISSYGEMPVVFAGGVMSNSIMRKRLSDCCEAYFAEPQFSADNAAGIALLCREKEL